MKAITLRNLPPEVSRRIQAEAERMGISLNRAVIRMLEKALGLERSGNRNVIHHDLDSLAGSWSKEEAQTFDKTLAKQRRIDPELW